MKYPPSSVASDTPTSLKNNSFSADNLLKSSSSSSSGGPGANDASNPLDVRRPR